MTPGMTIGQASEASGTHIETIRYYERIDILPKPERSAGNRRLYGPADVNRLRFVRHARELGFPLDNVRTLLDLSDAPDRPCAKVDRIARARLAEVHERIARLRQLEAELERIIGACSGGSVADCNIITALAG